MVLLLWRDLLLMQSYMDAVRHVYERGEDVLNERTGSYTRSVTGLTISHDCSKSFPLPTARRVALRIAFEEMMFFFRGDTNTLLLEEKNIGIWKGNTTREFLDKRGLRYLQVGDMGKGYGYQWRNFFGVDQLKRCFQELLDNPSSRQNLVSAWNPAELNQMALPPCHFSFQPLVRNGRIDLNVFLRSNDLPYGTPYNLMGYGFLLECMVNFMRNNGVQVNAGTLNLMIGDAHIYQNQMIGEGSFVYNMIERYYEIQLKLDHTNPAPKLEICKALNTFEDFLSLKWEDINLHGYKPQDDYTNKPGMVA